MNLTPEQKARLQVIEGALADLDFCKVLRHVARTWAKRYAKAREMPVNYEMVAEAVTATQHAIFDSWFKSEAFNTRGLSGIALGRLATGYFQKRIKAEILHTLFPDEVESRSLSMELFEREGRRKEVPLEIRDANKGRVRAAANGACFVLWQLFQRGFEPGTAERCPQCNTGAVDNGGRLVIKRDDSRAACTRCGLKCKARSGNININEQGVLLEEARPGKTPRQLEAKDPGPAATPAPRQLAPVDAEEIYKYVARRDATFIHAAVRCVLQEILKPPAPPKPPVLEKYVRGTLITGEHRDIRDHEAAAKRLHLQNVKILNTDVTEQRRFIAQALERTIAWIKSDGDPEFIKKQLNVFDAHVRYRMRTKFSEKVAKLA